MRLVLDGTDMTVPPATTLGELLDGAEPLIDPRRVVTSLDVDGRPVDPTDGRSLAAFRLQGAETITIHTQTPEAFATARRDELASNLRQIADLLAVAARGFTEGNTSDANIVLAEATRALVLVLELDQTVLQLIPGTSRCESVAEVIRRVGPRLEDAERSQRWHEVAELLSGELVPALRATAA
ncbi:MAG: hypothetical protein U0807_00600 [Candidatus Binatia bacterium]